MHTHLVRLFVRDPLLVNARLAFSQRAQKKTQRALFPIKESNPSVTANADDELQTGYAQ